MSEKYEKISRAIVDGEDEVAALMVEEALAEGLPPLEILNAGRRRRHHQGRRTMEGQQVFLAGRHPLR